MARYAESTYTKEVGDKICMLLMEGYSLRAICRRDDMPVISTVMLWLHRHEEFFAQYARAREVQAELLAEDVIEIADDSAGDREVDEGGKEYTNHEVINRSRLRVDARKWYTSKIAIRRFGDRIQHDQRITITDMSDDELDRKIQELASAKPEPGTES